LFSVLISWINNIFTSSHSAGYNLSYEYQIEVRDTMAFFGRQVWFLSLQLSFLLIVAQWDPIVAWWAFRIGSWLQHESCSFFSYLERRLMLTTLSLHFYKILIFDCVWQRSSSNIILVQDHLNLVFIWFWCEHNSIGKILYFICRVGVWNWNLLFINFKR
jgi:hypothetical protein